MPPALAVDFLPNTRAPCAFFYSPFFERHPLFLRGTPADLQFSSPPPPSPPGSASNCPHGISSSTPCHRSLPRPPGPRVRDSAAPPTPILEQLRNRFEFIGSPLPFLLSWLARSSAFCVPENHLPRSFFHKESR